MALHYAYVFVFVFFHNVFRILFFTVVFFYCRASFIVLLRLSSIPILYGLKRPKPPSKAVTIIIRITRMDHLWFNAFLTASSS